MEPMEVSAQHISTTPRELRAKVERLEAELSALYARYNALEQDHSLLLAERDKLSAAWRTLSTLLVAPDGS